MVLLKSEGFFKTLLLPEEDLHPLVATRVIIDFFCQFNVFLLDIIKMLVHHFYLFLIHLLILVDFGTHSLCFFPILLFYFINLFKFLVSDIFNLSIHVFIHRFITCFFIIEFIHYCQFWSKTHKCFNKITWQIRWNPLHCLCFSISLFRSRPLNNLSFEFEASNLASKFFVDFKKPFIIIL